MHKYIGYGLILFACTGFGFSKSQDMQRHLEQLEEMKKLFYLFRSELQYTRAPFEEVFEKVGRKTKEPFQTWLLNLSNRLRKKDAGSLWEIWNVSIQADLEKERLEGMKSYLKKDELEELRNIGKNLEYIESIDLYIEHLEYRMKHLREAYQTKQKLCRSMGIMGGIFLVILLL